MHRNITVLRASPVRRIGAPDAYLTRYELRARFSRTGQWSVPCSAGPGPGLPCSQRQARRQLTGRRTPRTIQQREVRRLVAVSVPGRLPVRGTAAPLYPRPHSATAERFERSALAATSVPERPWAVPARHAAVPWLHGGAAGTVRDPSRVPVPRPRHNRPVFPCRVVAAG